MHIQKMIDAASQAVAAREVPTIEQAMEMAHALHEMTVLMPEFLFFKKSFEEMGDAVYAAGESAKRNANEWEVINNTAYAFLKAAL